MNYDTIANTYSDKVDESAWVKYYERPATLKLLPALAGLDVLDAGCGNAFYSRLALDAGARVVAYDNSERIVEHARAEVGDRCQVLHCEAAQLKELLPPEARFDLILSNLVMHYVEDLDSEFRDLAALLRPGGRMIVSMHHPLLRGDRLAQVGYRKIEKLKTHWKWVDGDVVYFKRPLGAITAAIHGAGLLIEQLLEVEPLPEMAEKNPRDYAVLMRFPGFIHFLLRKA
jgi:SAM-dependent methyltransferase